MQKNPTYIDKINVTASKNFMLVTIPTIKEGNDRKIYIGYRNIQTAEISAFGSIAYTYDATCVNYKNQYAIIYNNDNSMKKGNYLPFIRADDMNIPDNNYNMTTAFVWDTALKIVDRSLKTIDRNSKKDAFIEEMKSAFKFFYEIVKKNVIIKGKKVEKVYKTYKTIDTYYNLESGINSKIKGIISSAIYAIYKIMDCGLIHTFNDVWNYRDYIFKTVNAAYEEERSKLMKFQDIETKVRIKYTVDEKIIANADIIKIRDRMMKYISDNHDKIDKNVYKAVFTLYFIKGYSIDTISEVIDKSYNRTYAILQKVIEILKVSEGVIEG